MNNRPMPQPGRPGGPMGGPMGGRPGGPMGGPMGGPPGGRHNARLHVEKPKHAKQTIGRLLKYLGRSGTLFLLLEEGEIYR